MVRPMRRSAQSWCSRRPDSVQQHNRLSIAARRGRPTQVDLARAGRSRRQITGAVGGGGACVAAVAALENALAFPPYRPPAPDSYSSYSATGPYRCKWSRRCRNLRKVSTAGAQAALDYIIRYPLALVEAVQLKLIWFAPPQSPSSYPAPSARCFREASECDHLHDPWCRCAERCRHHNFPRLRHLVFQDVTIWRGSSRWVKPAPTMVAADQIRAKDQIVALVVVADRCPWWRVA